MLFLLALSSSLGEPDLQKIAIGNWTTNISALGETPSLAYESLHIRIAKSPNNSVTASVFAANESSELITSFALRIPKTGPAEFGPAIDTLQQIPLASGPGTHRTASGRWQNFLYNFVYASETRVHLTLLDQSNSELLLFNILKDVDRTEKSWLRRYGLAIVGGVATIGAQIFVIWMQKKMMDAKNEIEGERVAKEAADTEAEKGKEKEKESPKTGAKKRKPHNK
jgi:hypothetical protein